MSGVKHDLSTSEGGRNYIAELFRVGMRRHDFERYIQERLAADFACALSRHLEARASDYDALQQRCRAQADVILSASHALGLPVDAGADSVCEAITDLQRKCAERYKAIRRLEDERDALRAEVERYRAAWDLWHEKTEWVQQAITEGALPARYLGMHRADILRAEVERLRALLAECANYLNTNELTSISHGSILHRKMIDAAMEARQ